MRGEQYVYRHHVYRYWSVTLGGDAAVVQVQRERQSGETLPGVWSKTIPYGRGFRAARDAALDEIEAAIARGVEPGEVG